MDVSINIYKHPFIWDIAFFLGPYLQRNMFHVYKWIIHFRVTTHNMAFNAQLSNGWLQRCNLNGSGFSTCSSILAIAVPYTFCMCIYNIICVCKFIYIAPMFQHTSIFVCLHCSEKYTALIQQISGSKARHLLLFVQLPSLGTQLILRLRCWNDSPWMWLTDADRLYSYGPKYQL